MEFRLWGSGFMVYDLATCPLRPLCGDFGVLGWREQGLPVLEL